MPSVKPVVQNKLRRVLKTIRKIVLWSLFGIIVLLLMIILLIQFPLVQNYVKNKIVSSLSEKLHTTVKLGYIKINFAGNLVLEDLFLADQQEDTVLMAEKLRVAVNPSGFFKKKVLINNVLLSGATFHYLVFDAEGRTNLDFVINAFSGGQKQEKTDSGEPWDIQVRKVQLNNSKFVYHNMGDSMKFALHLGRLRVDVGRTNLDSLLVDVENINLENTRASLLTYQKINKPDEVRESGGKADSSKALILSLKKINLKGVSFEQRDSLSATTGTYTIGEAEILPKKIDLSGQLIAIASIQLKRGIINYNAGSKPSGKDLNRVPGETSNPESSWKIWLEKGNLAFDKVRLRNLMPADTGLEYLADISLTNLVAGLSANFNGSESWNAALQSLRFEDERTSRLISLSANASSESGKISVSPLNFRLGSSHISAALQGNFGNSSPGSMPNLEGNIISSRLVMVDFVPYLPKSLYPNLNRIPGQVSITARLSSKDGLLDGAGNVNTNEGNVAFTASMEQGETARYNIKIDFNDLNAGFFAQNQQLGNLTASIEAQGSGFKPDSMNTDMNLKIASFNFKGVDYSDINLNGNVNRGNLKADVISGNPLAQLRMRINGQLGDYPDFRVNAHIGNLDLYALKLIEDTIALSGVIDASYASKGEGRFVASTDTMLVNVRMPKNEVNTNSRLFYSVLGDSVNAKVNSNFGDIAFEGNIPIQEIPAVMKNYFSQYFSKEKADSAQHSNKFFGLDVNIKDLAMLKDFMALDVDIPEDAKITTRLKDNQLTSNVNIEKIILKGIEIDGLKLNASGKDSSFLVDFKTAAVHNNVHTIRDISLNSSLRQGDLESRFSFSNAASQKWFDIGASMQPGNPQLNIILKEPLMLNHDAWQIDNQNRTYFQDKNVVFSNVRLTSGNKKISLLSDAQRPEKLAASFKNLTLALISEVLYGDTSYLSGKINGELMATYLFAKPVPVFDAKLAISDILLLKKPLGELNIDASNTANNDIAQLNINFGQQNMRFNVNGTYGLAKNAPMDLRISTQNLDLAALQPLIQETISGASGAINASLNVKGNVAAPYVTGEIAFDKAKAFIEPIQAGFQIDNQKILFRGEEIVFNKFTIKDNDGDPLEINGRIALAELKKLNYNLDIRTEDFLAYQGPKDNLPGQDNKVILTSNIKLTGEDKTPHVEADIAIVEGSNFFYKITKQASTLTEEGVIEFDGAKDTAEMPAQPISVANNLSLTANIDVAKNTAVRIITDPVRNLGLNMVAGGLFSLNQRPYQSPMLTGRLEISGGDYTISLSGIKRKFQIADSSFIVWYGNISKPELNLRAFYEVRTSPAELIGSNQTSGTLPFMVNMIISGSLDDPRFNFRLSLPREYEGVENGTVAAKLQEINSNESELNQMAMTLLLFGSFGFSNFANVLGNNGGTNVIISNALNQFAAQKLKFIDLHFDLESYDNYGGETQDNLRTEMKIAATKKLDNERLNIGLGATVVLQADEQEQKDPSIADRISPEFNIEYLLNKPRTLRVRTFRRSEYRGLVEGKVISTGAGILFQKDFNKLSELFKKPKKAEAVADNQQNSNDDQ